MKLEPNNIASILLELYGKTFGGKNKGRYLISKELLRQLSGRNRLQDSIIRQIIDEAFELRIVVIPLIDEFAVLHISVMGNYRKVTKNIVSEYSQKL